MKSVIQIEDRYYILASSSLADERNRVLKHGDTFAVFDRFGDIRAIGGEQGLYHEGTRFLSSSSLTLGGDRPMLLSSTVREDNATLTVDLTNPDIFEDGELVLPHGALHLFRRKFLWRGVCYERIRLTNYSMEPLSFSFTLHVGADFADVFEVRGMKRARRGTLREPEVADDGIRLLYDGLDQEARITQVSTTPPPDRVGEDALHFDLTLQAKESTLVDVTIACSTSSRARAPLGFDEAKARSKGELSAARAAGCSLHTSNEPFNAWLDRSAADLQLMTTETVHGPYPYAGIPWYSTPFGRDGLITALQHLWVAPEMARGVLTYLAETQATTVDPAMDAEPGKILHEARQGEMAALGEVPFGAYYGSVDSTPLFVMLAGAWWQRTADDQGLRELWPAILRAMDWIAKYGDIDGDGFVEYARHSDDGLLQQGWKDSHDSVFYDDGSLVEAPVALCEVQSYVYGAYRAGVLMARHLGHRPLAEQWIRRARELRRSFDAAFWCDDLGTYALALDGRKRPCRVRSSNAGHCLLTGLALPQRAARLAATLTDASMFTGFGIRTLAEGERRYDPMSYHNGSIWPHDNALIGMGLARYGYKDEACRVLDGLFHVSTMSDLQRLPELFCGFPRRTGEGPTRYPVACSPQAWASASVFALLQAVLGLWVDARRRRIHLDRPSLPSYLQEVHVMDLAVGPGCSVDLVFRRHRDDVGINVLRREGPVEIVTVK